MSHFPGSEFISLGSQGKFPMTHGRDIGPHCTVEQPARFHHKFNTNSSLGSLGNQVLRDQERSISHLSSEWRQRDG